MSWEETPTGRLTVLIHRLFEEYFKKNPQRDHSQDNALLKVRNLVVQAVETFLKESGIHKQYGIPIDSLSLISFAADEEAVNPQGSWVPIPCGKDETRPAGITNEEFNEFSERLSKLFIDQGMYTSGLFINVLNLFREAFLKPTENRPFTQGTYVRLIFGSIANAETIIKQAVPCEVCEENRVVDICHIIPTRIKGTRKIDNVIFLCPTHHRLFDACMMSKEEWNKIDWSRKARKSQIYAEKVLKVAHGQFWEKMDSGIYRKQTTWETDLYGLYKENEKELNEEA